MQITVGKYYELTKKLSSGSFGEIFLAINKKNNNQVAVKLEDAATKSPQLEYEAKLLAYLNQNPIEGFPKLHYYAREGKYNVMIIDLLGPSLQQLFQKCGKIFDLQTTVMIGIQILNRLEQLHIRKFIHRDIKPQNFLLGRYQNCGMIYLIDFGLSKKYLQKDGSHIPYKDNKTLTGTPRYASINSHLGIQHSRRDDLQSVFYMLIYFLKGFLPWQNLKSDSNLDKYQRILERKLAISVHNLVSGLPSQFGQILQYAKDLHFIEQPDYQFCRRKLLQALGRQLTEDDLFCWQKIQINENNNNDQFFSF